MALYQIAMLLLSGCTLCIPWDQWRLNARAYLGLSPGPRPIRGLLIIIQNNNDDKLPYSRCHYSALQWHLVVDVEVEGGPPLSKQNVTKKI